MKQFPAAYKGFNVKPRGWLTSNLTTARAAYEIVKAHDADGKVSEETLVSLLADLRHMCDGLGWEFDDLVERSENPHDDEVRESVEAWERREKKQNKR